MCLCVLLFRDSSFVNNYTGAAETSGRNSKERLLRTKHHWRECVSLDVWERLSLICVNSYHTPECLQKAGDSELNVLRYGECGGWGASLWHSLSCLAGTVRWWSEEGHCLRWIVGQAGSRTVGDRDTLQFKSNDLKHGFKTVCHIYPVIYPHSPVSVTHLLTDTTHYISNVLIQFKNKQTGTFTVYDIKLDIIVSEMFS